MVLGKILAAGAILGAAGGYLFGLVLRNHWMPEFLHNVSTLSLVFVAFAVSDWLRPQSGLVTVTVMGIWLANMPGVEVEEILDFKKSLSILLISLLFVILAARIDLASLRELGWSSLIVLGTIQFLARPLNVMVSAAGSKLTWPERHMLAWIAPRGFLIIGTNVVSRAIARALAQNGFRVLLADMAWDKVSQARMEGLPTCFGNAMSEHAERHLDLIGIGRLLALSEHENLNVAAIMHYRMEFGQNNVFLLQSRSDQGLSPKLKVVSRRRGYTLFGSRVTYESLAAMLKRGGGECERRALRKASDPRSFTGGTVKMQSRFSPSTRRIDGTFLRWNVRSRQRAGGRS